MHYRASLPLCLITGIAWIYSRPLNGNCDFLMMGLAERDYEVPEVLPPAQVVLLDMFS